MSRLHPDLEKLLPQDCLGIGGVNFTTDADITAFALAVARAERERCIDALRETTCRWDGKRGCRGDNSYTVRALPDPDWSTA
jgi:hypothetical protein